MPFLGLSLGGVTTTAFGVEVEFAGRGSIALRHVNEAAVDNYLLVVSLVARHYAPDEYPLTSHTVRMAPHPTMPDRFPPRRLHSVVWTDPQGRPWRVEPEYVSHGVYDGYELVSPPMSNASEFAAALHDVLASGLVGAGERSATHIHVDAQALLQCEAPGLALANLLILSENYDEVVRALFGTRHNGGADNEFSLSLQRSHPKLLRQLTALSATERTMTQIVAIFDQHRNHELLRYGGDKTKLWKYLAVSPASLVNLEPDHHRHGSQTGGTIEFRAFDVFPRDWQYVAAIEFARALVNHAVELARDNHAVTFKLVPVNTSTIETLLRTLQLDQLDVFHRLPLDSNSNSDDDSISRDFSVDSSQLMRDRRNTDCIEPCQNGGTCSCAIDTKGSTCECVCEPSFTGLSCESVVDTCLSNPCPPPHSACTGHGTSNGMDTLVVADAYAASSFTLQIDLGSASVSSPSGGGTVIVTTAIDVNDANEFVSITAGGQRFDFFFGSENLPDCDLQESSADLTPAEMASFLQNATAAGVVPVTVSPVGLTTPCVDPSVTVQVINYAIGFSCDCQVGFTGASCETNIDDCQVDTCANGGTCLDGVESVLCECVTGFTGDFCDVPTDECASSPCQNDGACFDSVNTFFCSCPTGFEGDFCETDLDECASSPCRNGGTCNNLDGFFHCDCPLGFSDTDCGVNDDECGSSPCENGGTCLDAVDGFTCACTSGFVGALCHEDADSCASSPCAPPMSVCTPHGSASGNSVQHIPDVYSASSYTLSFDLGVASVGSVGGQLAVNGAIDVNEPSEFIRVQAGSQSFDVFNGEEELSDCAAQSLVLDFTLTEWNRFTESLSPNGILNVTVTPVGVNTPCVDPSLTVELTSYAAGFQCACDPGFTGASCETNIDECAALPCQNGGTCFDSINAFFCLCARGFTNDVCDQELDECESEPCLNNGVCQDTVNRFVCNCEQGYTGTLCQSDTNECLSAPCFNQGTCEDHAGFFACQCLTGFSGIDCSIDEDECLSLPCANGGTCTDAVAGFTCACSAQFVGTTCNNDVDSCMSSPCSPPMDVCIAHGSESASDTQVIANAYTQASYTLTMNLGAAGASAVSGTLAVTTSADVNSLSEIVRVAAGGQSFDFFNLVDEADNCTTQSALLTLTPNEWSSFMQASSNGQVGLTVTPIGLDSPCVDPSITVTLASYPPGFQCACQPGFTGTACETNIDDCAPSPCDNGATCVDLVNTFSCICDEGFSGEACEEDIDECLSEPCLNNAACFDDPGTFVCECLAGFTGARCETDINECASAPCVNGATCVNHDGFFECQCVPGFFGERCETNQDECGSSPCENGATCTDSIDGFTCTCASEFNGVRCENAIASCLSSPCAAPMDVCIAHGPTTSLTSAAVPDAYTAPSYTLTLNLGPGVASLAVSATLTVTSSIDINQLGEYIFVAAGAQSFDFFNIDETLDNCTLQTATIDMTLSEVSLFLQDASPVGQVNVTVTPTGVTMPCLDPSISITLETYEAGFLCVCPSGFTGAACEINIDDCPPSVCANGGSCVDGVNAFSCTCSQSFTGEFCEENVNECLSEPCLNLGQCVDGVGGYTCSCVAGFTDLDCGVDINECTSSPCLNGGTCEDHSGFFACQCLPGYSTNDCSINNDECASAPCQNGGTCVDGVDGFACTCPAEFLGSSTCNTRTNACQSSPCSAPMDVCTAHGPASGSDSHVIADAYTSSHFSFTLDLGPQSSTTAGGLLLVETAIDVNELSESVRVSAGNQVFDFFNSGDVDLPDCTQQSLVAELTGNEMAGLMQDSLDGVVTVNVTLFGVDTTCPQTSLTVELTNYAPGFLCGCATGFTGTACETNIDDCGVEACLNGGTCVDGVESFSCVCATGFFGESCSLNVDECASQPCINGGVCVDGANSFVCQCPAGFTGADCTQNVDECLSQPCLNGGSCSESVNDFACVCPLEFTGALCGSAIDFCASSPCVEVCTAHGSATSVDSHTIVDAYTAPMYSFLLNVGSSASTGGGRLTATTAIDVNEPGEYAVVSAGDVAFEFFRTSSGALPNCTSIEELADLSPSEMAALVRTAVNGQVRVNVSLVGVDTPCGNPSLTVQLTNFAAGFTCSCRAGFTGVDCDVNLDDCVGDPCKNGATCVDGVQSHVCVCASGYTGTECAEDINECASAPCENDGTCIDAVAGFACACVSGYTGVSCQVNIDECASTPCENGSTCTDLVNEYSCLCASGYTGNECEVDIDECASQPCGLGTCNDGTGSFTCTCGPRNTGVFCETAITGNDCASQPCQSGGTCLNLFEGVLCLCQQGFTGELCETAQDDCASTPCSAPLSECVSHATQTGNATHVVPDMYAAASFTFTLDLGTASTSSVVGGRSRDGTHVH